MYAYRTKQTTAPKHHYVDEKALLVPLGVGTLVGKKKLIDAVVWSDNERVCVCVCAEA